MSKASTRLMSHNSQKAAIYIAEVANFDIGLLSIFLSEQERVRADRFRRVEDRQLHILAHSLKRAVLSTCLNVSPASLEFSTEFNGKPVCTHPNAPYFNLTHSHGWVALAVSPGSQVGIDVEFSRDGSRVENIVSRVASSEELAVYRVSENPKQAFLCLWTQKEAVSKACGMGLSVGLSTIPCSGVVGNCSLAFLGKKYVLHTHSVGSEGVLSYVSECLGGKEALSPQFFYVQPEKKPRAASLFQFNAFTLY